MDHENKHEKRRSHCYGSEEAIPYRTSFCALLGRILALKSALLDLFLLPDPSFFFFSGLFEDLLLFSLPCKFFCFCSVGSCHLFRCSCLTA